MRFKYVLFIKLCAVFITLLLCLNTASSQKAFEKFAFTDSFPSYNLHLYNGSEYRDYDHRIKGTPYAFNAINFTNGSIRYYGNFYENIPMLYNVQTDEIIIKRYDSVTAIQLANVKISSFTINNHFFIRIDRYDSSNTLLKTGFYDVLYNGRTELLCKRKKEVDERIVMQTLEQKFIIKDKYFVARKNDYDEVSSPKALVRLLDLKKKNMLRYWKQNNIKYKQNAEAAMIAVCSYYDKTNAAK